MRNPSSFASSLFASSLISIAIAGCAAVSDEPAAHGASSAATIDVSTTAAADPCSTWATELSALLASAQQCNVAAANPTQCASWVPSLDGCEQPVAYAGSDATKKYLALFDTYAASCPLPDPPCVDPATLAVDCTQAPNIDSLGGSCAITSHP